MPPESFIAVASIPVKLAPLPEKLVAVNVPFAELNVKLLPVFGATCPVSFVANKTLQDVLLDSSETPTDNAVVAVPVNVPWLVILPVTLRVVTVVTPEITKPLGAVGAPFAILFVMLLALILDILLFDYLS